MTHLAISTATVWDNGHQTKFVVREYPVSGSYCADSPFFNTRAEAEAELQRVKDGGDTSHWSAFCGW